MNKEAKIHLSALESELVTNTQWIFTKQSIIKKVQLILGDLHEYYKQVVQEEKEFLPEILQKPGGKITKGENYKGLPYLILDYPALYSKEDIFVVRTMFWWGNFFSITLQLSGSFASQYNQGLAEAIQDDLLEGWYINATNEMWDHHFEETNYIPVDSLTTITGHSSIKLAKKIPLHQWDNALVFLQQNFETMIALLR